MSKVLLADDSPLMLKVVESIFINDKDDFELSLANDGIEACRIAVSEDPDIIVLDWQMPNLSGKQTIQRLRRFRKTKNKPILVMTGGENVEEVFASGADDYVHKPVKKEELLARVKYMLKSQANLLKLKKNEKRLSQQSKRLNELLELVNRSDNALVIISPDGEIVWSNEGFERMFGYTYLEFTELFKGQFINTRFLNVAKTAYKQCKIRKKSVVYKGLARAKYKGKIEVYATFTPFFDRSDELEKIVCMFTDVSEVANS